jgi:type II secretory ATPase GspE/PulE/Tfp pilus assembly ATPase PilB-like protein
MRVLLSSERFSNFAALGIEGRDLDIIKRMLEESGSLLLVVGPTGSGKTTTLYTMMQQINKPEVNILTVEDPIEYDIPRVSQTQVNERAGLTFASALRSFLRQDPDIIMVGEIRDAETTELVIHATLTGHTVLSTLHTDDAPSAIPRLLDLGAEEFLLASTLHAVIAQRLVRRICTDCIERITMTDVQKKILQDRLSRANPKYRKAEYQFSNKVYKGAGCDSCNHSGYKGRIGIYEVLEVTQEVINLIMEKSSADRIRDKALEQGYTTMLEDGIKKVERGSTTVEELLRVTPA